MDIIHSSENFGLSEKSGHMDFYPDLGPSEYNELMFFYAKTHPYLYIH